MGGKHCKHHPRMIQMVGLLWFTMVYYQYGLLWFTMVYYGLLWFTSTLDSDVELVLNGIQWDFSWFVIHINPQRLLRLGFLQHLVLGSQATGLSPEPQSWRHPVWNSESRCANNSQNSAKPCSKLKKTWKYACHESSQTILAMKTC